MDHITEVLLIEDEALDRELVQEVLALKGRGRIRVTEAGDFSAGLRLLETRAFDLVMLDTRLPDVSALSALRAIGEQAPHTPILPHPTFITPQVRHAARQRGAFDVAVRGDLNVMWSAVQSLLSLRSEGAAPNRVAS
jgi:two-component system, NtrC family, response regulator HydG